MQNKYKTLAMLLTAIVISSCSTPLQNNNNLPDKNNKITTNSSLQDDFNSLSIPKEQLDKLIAEKKIKKELLKSKYKTQAFEGSNKIFTNTAGTIFNKPYTTNSAYGFNSEAYLLAYYGIYTGWVLNGLNIGYPNFSAFSHYLAGGYNEKRIWRDEYIKAKIAVSEGFNERAYLRSFTDVAQNWTCTPVSSDTGCYKGYTHYLATGRRARKTSMAQYKTARINDQYVFNDIAYILTFTDVINFLIAGTGSAYDHFLYYGDFGAPFPEATPRLTSSTYITNYQKTQTAYKDGFNEAAYLLAYNTVADTVTTQGNGLLQYVTTGQTQGKLSTSVYTTARTQVADKLFGIYGENNYSEDVALEKEYLLDNYTITSGQTRTFKFDDEQTYNTQYHTNRTNPNYGLSKKFVFMGIPGERCVIKVSQLNGGDPYLKLLDPAGNIVVQNDDYNGLDSYIDYTIPNDPAKRGLWTIQATTFERAVAGNPVASGTYDVSLSRGNLIN